MKLQLKSRSLRIYRWRRR